jgi:hypothetical protein
MTDEPETTERERYAAEHPRCPSCFRREGHSPNCAVQRNWRHAPTIDPIDNGRNDR